MALIVESGLGLSDAESYLSVADADTYHDAQGAPDAWVDSSDALKEAALRIATQYLDAVYGLRWDGTRINATMALDWPRTGILDRDSYAVDDESVPLAVKHATAYLALKVREGDTLIPDVDPGSGATSSSVTVGPISIDESFGGSGSSSTLPYYPTVTYMLGELISSAGRVYRS